MQLETDKRYTNKEIVQALNVHNKALRSEIGSLGHVIRENKEEIMQQITTLKNDVGALSQWKSNLAAVEEDRRLRRNIEKNPWQQIAKDALKMLGWALLILAAILKVSL